MKKLISEAEQKRLDRYAKIKKEFASYSGAKTVIVKALAKKLKVSSATIYKALKS